METSKNYYESVMRDFGMYARGRSLEQYCRDEAVDIKWLTKAMEQYGVPEEDRKPRQKRRAAVRTADKTPEMIRLHYDPEAEIAATPATSCGTAVDAEASIVRERFGKDPRMGSRAFIFFSKDLRKVKILHYSLTGYEIYIKWFDNGKCLRPVFSKIAKTHTITRSQLLLLLTGAVRKDLRIN